MQAGSKSRWASGPRAGWGRLTGSDWQVARSPRRQFGNLPSPLVRGAWWPALCMGSPEPGQQSLEATTASRSRRGAPARLRILPPTFARATARPRAEPGKVTEPPPGLRGPGGFRGCGPLCADRTDRPGAQLRPLWGPLGPQQSNRSLRSRDVCFPR